MHINIIKLHKYGFKKLEKVLFKKIFGDQKETF